MSTTHQRERDAQLRALLIALYAHGPSPITTTASTAGRDRRVALRALRLGCVELLTEERLPRDRAEAGLRAIRLADLGRAVLGLPEPGPLGDRDPIDVLRAGVKLFMGCDAFAVTVPPEDWAGPVLLASAQFHTRGKWPDELDAIAVFAAEQGVVCECLFDHDGRDGWELIGYQSPESGSTP